MQQTVDETLLAADFHGAVLRVVRAETRQACHLVFASVELVPQEIPLPPQSEWECQPVSVGTPRGRLAFRRIVLEDPLEAFRWYKRVAERNGAEELPSCPGLGKPLLAPQHRSESVPGRLALMRDVPFAADWYGDVRVGHLIAMEDPPALVATIAYDAAARLWLKERIHFDPFDRNEWLQSVALLAPNPLLRTVRMRMVPPREDAEGAVFIRGEPRTGKSLSNLRLLVTERTIEGVLRIEELRFGIDGRAVLRCPHEPEDVGVVVLCPERGPLVVQDPTPFLKTIAVNATIRGPRRRVTVPPTVKRPGATLKNDLSSLHSFSAGSAGPEVDARRRLVELRSRRERRDRSAPEQRWYESIAAAREILGGIVGSAERDLVIVDPYLDGQALIEFSQCVTFDHVVVRALVSERYVERKDAREGMTATVPSGDGDAADIPPLTEGAELVRTVRSVRSVRGATKATVKVMADPGTAIHGRYLVIDGNVWMLSESLKDAGKTPGGAVRLGDPKAALIAIERAWEKATDLDAFAEKKRLVPPSDQDEESSPGLESDA